MRTVENRSVVITPTSFALPPMLFAQVVRHGWSQGGIGCSGCPAMEWFVVGGRQAGLGKRSSSEQFKGAARYEQLRRKVEVKAAIVESAERASLE